MKAVRLPILAAWRLVVAAAAAELGRISPCYATARRIDDALLRRQSRSIQQAVRISQHLSVSVCQRLK